MKEYLADPLLLPLALAGGGRYRCLRLTEHTTTNIETIKYFWHNEITHQTQADGSVLIEIGGA